MEGLKSKMVGSLIGMSTALAGMVSVVNCSAAGCPSCYRCAGVGFGVVLLAVLSKDRKDGRGSKG